MESAIEASVSPFEVATPSKTPTKNRSFSDPPTAAQAALQPSPTFRERVRHGRSKDDHAVPTTPKPSRRPDFLTRGLSLQMPPPSPATASHVNGWSRALAVPLSPKLDERDVYMQQGQQNLSASPATSLPRHSRGLDFSRACTSLHHSTLAEQSSPDSSPVITQKGMAIPLRKGSMSSMMLDSPNMHGLTSVPWGSLAPERSTVSSSVGSVNMLGSESESSDSDGDASMGDDQDDAIFTTPQVHKLQNPSAATPFAGPQTPIAGTGPGWGSGSQFSPAQASLMKTVRRIKLNKGGRRTRKSSSSASGSGYSSMASPRATSPPALRSIESATGTSGFLPWAANAARSRRESLALGTDGLHLSSGNDSGDEASSHTIPSTPGVVRRAVTRRGNLLPKTKGFARIRAALAEEAAPVDSEIRRESETIRQVRERDNSPPTLDLSHDIRPGTATAASSPNLLPAVPESAQEDFGRDLDSETSNSNKGLGMNFAVHATRNSGGMEYWNRFDPSMRTPPPPSFVRQSSSIMSDVNMDSPAGQSGVDVFWRRPRARSSASDAPDAFAAPSAPAPVASVMNDDVAIKKFKRRREDDFDIATIKRRAVSPGMSTQNSPVLTHSPSQRDVQGTWGQPPDKRRENQPGFEMANPQLMAVRSNSGGSTVGLASGNLVSQGKKLGLQGMTDTNDGLMKMSIE
ncbi:hypothetical protein LTR36_006376 [Oleoguttula mirabilis]|uniref:Uncharacterized protein n=1 Tax=Oleoguttula mirabilis TaxID=1507867 RepID=A0AAV9JUU8_9PEZI|nr:hypothetical protein LTR36_006376 [Oleoguttula mirabilis]